MNILVCGGAGYIGSHMCKLLARSGHVPVTFERYGIAGAFNRIRCIASWSKGSAPSTSRDWKACDV